MAAITGAGTPIRRARERHTEGGAGGRMQFCIPRRLVDWGDAVNKSKPEQRSRPSEIRRGETCRGLTLSTWRMFEVNGAQSDEMWSFVCSASLETLWLKDWGRINGSSYFKMLLRSRLGLHSNTLNDALNKKKKKIRNNATAEPT